MVHLNQGETVGDKIRAAEQPNYRMFTSPTLPKEIEKDPENIFAGSSEVTISGMKDKVKN
ncbi:MAG: hypothetical protein QM811_22180 [Pirellulales bacterium]